MSRPPLPNPFHSALRLKGLNVWLRPDDLLSIRRGLTPDAADKLLQHHGSTIAACMISAGIDAARRIIESGGHDA